MAIIRAEEINSRESFEAWLVSLPGLEQFQASLVLASRSALRVLPLIYDVLDPQSRANPSEKMVLGAFRANMISHVAIKFPANEIANAANLHFAAADFSRRVDSSNASNAAYFAAATASAVQGNFAAEAAANAISFAELAQNSIAGNLFEVSDLSEVTDLSDLAEFWKTLSAEALAIEQGFNPVSLSYQTLWSETPPNWWQDAMEEFERLLGRLEHTKYQISPGSPSQPTNSWFIWLEWYRSIALGQHSFGLPVTFADELDKQIALGFGIEGFWDSDPIIINAEVAAWVKEAKATAALAQEQGNGLQFELREGLIGLARGLGLSSPKDDQSRIQQQLPILIELVKKLEVRIERSELPRDNLLWAITNLRETVTRNTENIGATELFSATTIFRHQLAAAKEPIAGSNVFSLDGPDLAWSQSVALISDMIVLATEEGRKLFDDADRAETDAGELDHYRKLEIELLDIIAENGQIMEPEAIRLLKQVILIGNLPPNPNRTSYLSWSSMRNAMLVISAVGVVGSVAYTLAAASPILAVVALVTFVGKTLFGEGIKKSKPGEIINSAITDQINDLTVKSIQAIRPKLREIAGNRPSYQWLRDLWDWADEQEKKKPPN